MIIVNEVKKIMIVSPHYDDAVLSCAGLIGSSIEKGIMVEICNVFTKIHKGNVKLSKVIREYIAEDLNEYIIKVDMKLCKKWIQLRRKEDDMACNFLNCSKRDLGYTDAIFRMKSNQYIYDAEEKLFDGYDEENLKIDLSNRIKDICKGFDACFFPMAVGKHVDHQIIHDVGLEVKKYMQNVYFYCEIPYSINFLNLYLNKEKFYISNYMELKINAICFYKTQLKGLFGNEKIADIFIPNYEIYVM